MMTLAVNLEKAGSCCDSCLGAEQPSCIGPTLRAARVVAVRRTWEESHCPRVERRVLGSVVFGANFGLRSPRGGAPMRAPMNLQCPAAPTRIRLR